MGHSVNERTIPYLIIMILLGYIFLTNNKTQTVIIPSKTNEITINEPEPIQLKEPNKIAAEKYEEATTPEEKKKIFKEAVKERVYVERLQDSVQTIEVKSIVVGELIEQQIKYTTKPLTFERKSPKTNTHLYLGGSTTLPTQLNEKITMGANLHLVTNKTIYSIGYDLNKNINVGVALKIF